ncbi:MAG: N-acetylmuramoyl-L-alanine amidase [Candidatus Hydrogenedentes bacterium]|nr:N-acetylmuramoyl-L-alanine amidase [Candidatus Hydrogenedentota bacterium]
MRFPNWMSLVAARARAVILILAAVTVNADTVTYHAQVGPELRTCTVNIVEVNGMASVPLNDIVNQLGGDVTVNSGAIEISLHGATAHIAVDDTRVASSHNEFTIQHPVRAQDNNVFVSVNDIAPLFSYGFKLTLQTGDAAMQPSTQSATETPLPPPVPLQGRKLRVILDPGHGGIDPGEGGPNGSEEKTIALAVAQRAAELLEDVCAPVLTRKQDASLTIKERVSAANVSLLGDRPLRGDLFISIHTGASSSPVPSGCDVFCPPQPQDVAGQANAQRSLALGRSISNAVAESTGIPSRGVHQMPARTFVNLQMPGVLVEVGFITNPKEEPLLVTPEYQDKIARGIAAGIASYIQGVTQ